MLRVEGEVKLFRNFPDETRCGELFDTPGSIDINRTNKANNYVDDSDVVFATFKNEFLSLRCS